MRISSELLLTFLLNAVWQIALITALATFGGWLLRNAGVRYRHWLYVSALCLALIVPLVTPLVASSRSFFETEPVALNSTAPLTAENTPLLVFAETSPDQPVARPASTFRINQTLGFALLTAYFGFVLFRLFKLAQAWRTTRDIRRLAVDLEPDETVAAIMRRCEREMGNRSQAIRALSSETLAVPVTIGLFKPVIILPAALLREGDTDLLTSAIGHEFIHVARRDYLLNLIYELVFVPISFHPAAAFLRRRVKQTRELCCDELVAERILNPEVYARSLVTLASSAPPLRRLSVTTTVGIADADILEARIMSLLKKPELKIRWKKSLLVIVTLLLLVPCAAAATFAMRFDVEANRLGLITFARSQEPQQKKERREYVVTENEQRAKEAKSEMLRQKLEEQKRMIENDPALREEIERKQAIEMEMMEVRQAALIRLAKINMDQAIQIATSQQPGKVLLCSLDAKGWEEPGKLSKEGQAFYHVMIVDETNGERTHVWVNAIDGTVMKTEKELLRKQRRGENE